MGRALTQQQTPTPGVKLRYPGAYVVVCIADVAENLPMMKYNSNPPIQETTQDGRPKFQDKVIGIVVQSDGAEIKTPEGAITAPAPGDIVSIWLGSYNRWEWGQAKTKLGRAVEIGDHFRWLYERDEQGQGEFPRKVRLCAIRAPKPEEAATVAAADALYDQINPPIQLTQNDGYQEEGPFDHSEPPADQWHETPPHNPRAQHSAPQPVAQPTPAPVQYVEDTSWNEPTPAQQTAAQNVADHLGGTVEPEGPRPGDESRSSASRYHTQRPTMRGHHHRPVGQGHRHRSAHHHEAGHLAVPGRSRGGVGQRPLHLERTPPRTGRKRMTIDDTVIDAAVVLWAAGGPSHITHRRLSEWTGIPAATLAGRNTVFEIRDATAELIVQQSGIDPLDTVGSRSASALEAWAWIGRCT